MNNEQVINSNSVPSTNRYDDIPVLGKTQIIPTEVIVQQATQVVPSVNQQVQVQQQIVPVNQVFNNVVQQQQVRQQPYQQGAVQVVPQVQQQVVQQPVQQQVVAQQPIIDDSMLQKEFIGTNYDKIMTSQFNLFAALFNFFYYFYRKMYIYGILLSFLMASILVITRSLIIIIVMCGLVGLITNVIYKRFSLRKVQAIREDNEDKNINEIIELCKDEGNTSVGSVIFGVMAEGIAGAIIGIIVFIFLLSKVNL
jgi:hypothetical protein